MKAADFHYCISLFWGRLLNEISYCFLTNLFLVNNFHNVSFEELAENIRWHQGSFLQNLIEYNHISHIICFEKPYCPSRKADLIKFDWVASKLGSNCASVIPFLRCCVSFIDQCRISPTFIWLNSESSFAAMAYAMWALMSTWKRKPIDNYCIIQFIWRSVLSACELHKHLELVLMHDMWKQLHQWQS